ncbi:MAG: energy transducer TonB, partial [Pseudomonadota bacterium]
PLPPIAAPQAPPQPSAPVAPPRFDADYLDNPKPVYPPLSRRMGEEGKVVLRVFVDASGLPAQVEVRTSSGSERLDRAAVSAIGRWKFVPARQGSEAVAAWVLVPIVFSLKE